MLTRQTLLALMRQLKITLLVFLLCSHKVAAEQNCLLAIERPLTNETTKDTYLFSVSSCRPTALAEVELRLGSKLIGTTRTYPFHVLWNTGYAADGSYALQATGRDRANRIVSSTERVFTIKNHGNTLSVMSPDLLRPLRGLVRLSLFGIDSQYYPAIWTVIVDGQPVGGAWTDNAGLHMGRVSPILDTTEYTNGTHELYVGMYSDSWPVGEINNKTWHDWRGGFERIVSVSNGHALMEIAANFLHLYLLPGERTLLTCRQLFTDQTTAPCISAAYSSTDPSIVDVNGNGVTTARKEGFATVRISAEGKQTNAYVWVRHSLNVPHFSGDGHFLNDYDPARSIFIVAPFSLEAHDLASDRKLLEAVHNAGINTLSEGLYRNPRNINYTFSAWRQFYDAYIEPDWKFAKRNNFHVLATGDEICRNIGGEAWWTLNWPDSKRAVQYSFRGLAESGIGLGVDMVDEASMLWGTTPTPPGMVGTQNSFTNISCMDHACSVHWEHNPVNEGRVPSGIHFALIGSRNRNLNTPAGKIFTATHITANSFNFSPAGTVNGTFDKNSDPGLEFLWWVGTFPGCPTKPCSPPLPNDALHTITDWVHELHPTLPISWPALGQSPPTIQANWMGPNGISDYASHYWVPLYQRHVYAWSQGIQELGYWMSQFFYSRQPDMMLDRPQIMLDSIAGPAYIKETKGAAYYDPPADQLDQPGTSGPAITATMMTAAALGVAGVRLYMFESPRLVAERASARVGSYLQTGINPEADDNIVREHWGAVNRAANVLTGLLSPYLLGTALNSPAYGRNIITAARLGPDGRMLMIVNDNDWKRTISVDFTQYTYGHKARRYLISSEELQPSVLPEIKGETVSLGTGETVVYLFSKR